MAALNIPLLYCKDLNTVHSKLYSVYSTKIASLLTQQFNDEDIEGESNLLAGLSQYQMAILLVTLFYKDFSSQKYTFSYLLTFYKISELRECFRCVGIDLQLLFTTIGIDLASTRVGKNEGINSISFETTFKIENAISPTASTSTGTKVDLTQLIAKNYSSTILIT